MANPQDQQREQDGVLLATRQAVKRPVLYNVLLHNDDYTTQELVVDVLTQFFHKTETEARHVMLTVHHKGQGVAGTYSKDVAESKVAQVTDYARTHGAPLKLTAEPA
ncbi:MAG: ATP-dependent Clp protease adaptor ClpS [Myxococcota bacterium]